MSTLEEIISTAKLPEQAVTICVRGDLLAQHADLNTQLAALGKWEPTSLAEADPRTAIAEAIVDLEDQMKATEVTFRFRALGRRKYRELGDAHPSDEGRFNMVTFAPALIAACCIDPVMTPTDVERLFDVLNEGAVELLFMAAYQANEGVSRVPFSKAAYELTQKPPSS